MKYHSDGRDFFIVNKRVIWNDISDEHKTFIREMIDKFNASMVTIRSSNKIFFNKEVER